MILIVVAAEYSHDASRFVEKIAPKIADNYAVHLHAPTLMSAREFAVSVEIVKRSRVLVITGNYIGPHLMALVNRKDFWDLRIVLASSADDLLRIGREEGWDEWPELTPIPEAAPESADAEVVTVYDPDATAASAEELPF